MPGSLAFCWVHARRKLFDVFVATKSPIADEALQRIAALYGIESGIRGEPAEQRERVRAAAGDNDSRRMNFAMSNRRRIYRTSNAAGLPGPSR